MMGDNPNESFVFMGYGSICIECGTVWNNEEAFDFCPFCDAVFSDDKINFGANLK
ncbi:hypothetical protein [Methanonatronarchaeum thermophilum]|uniref:hypothetical protein n=1 Tax=Methanonatronarchaeum thermophilum TaxID=1927129 RepID=UPI0013747499|nr:hypothetical protein [Methanonatronarchaeum thermophilum]